MRKAKVLTRQQKNGIIAALFLFQYSLLIPLMGYFNSTLVIAASGILLMAAVFKVNCHIVLNKWYCLLAFGISVLVMLKSMIDDSELKVLFTFLMISLPASIVFSYQFDKETFLQWCVRLAYVNAFILLFSHFALKKIAYMRFGYGMLLTVLFSYLVVFNHLSFKRRGTKLANDITVRIFRIVILIVSFFTTVILGSRGALISILSFIAINVFLIHKKNSLRNIVLFIVAFVAIWNMDSILSIAISLCNQIGVRSYALKKYQYQLTYGIKEASSGRSSLYEMAFNQIIANPFFGSKMISYDDGTHYVHNLFLQVGRDMGILPMLLVIVHFFYCIYLMSSRKYDAQAKTIIAVFFCVSIVRLLISSNLWERPEYWACMCITLNAKIIFMPSSSPPQPIPCIENLIIEKTG